MAAAVVLVALLIALIAVELLSLRGRIVFRERVDLINPQNLAIFVNVDDTTSPGCFYRVHIVSHAPDQRLRYALRGPEGNGIYYHVEQYSPGSSRSFQFCPSQQGRYLLRLEAARPTQGDARPTVDVRVLRDDHRVLLPFFSGWTRQ